MGVGVALNNLFASVGLRNIQHNSPRPCSILSTEGPYSIYEINSPIDDLSMRCGFNCSEVSAIRLYHGP